jgi:hypothetical protein
VNQYNIKTILEKKIPSGVQLLEINHIEAHNIGQTMHSASNANVAEIMLGGIGRLLVVQCTEHKISNGHLAKLKLA